MKSVFTIIVLIFTFFINFQNAFGCGCTTATPPPGYCNCQTEQYYDVAVCEKYFFCGKQYDGSCGVPGAADGWGTSCSIVFDQVEDIGPPIGPNGPNKVCGSIVNIENRSVQENIPLIGSNQDLCTHQKELKVEA